VNAQPLKTTLLLIPGGSELALPEHTNNFKQALTQAIENNTLEIIMLADMPLIPEEVVQSRYKYKNVLAIESDEITTPNDALRVVKQMLKDHLPHLYTSGFDYQVVKMQFIEVKYEDFERLAKFT